MIESNRARRAALLVSSPLGAALAPATVTATAVVTAVGRRQSPPTTSPPALLLPASRSDHNKGSEQRELKAHALSLHCGESVLEMAAAELAAATAVDPRVTVADLDRAVDRARRAKDLIPVRQSVLCGFTRVVDVKLKLTPAFVAHLCADVAQKDQQLLLEAIDKGPGPPSLPGTIAFPQPQGKVELMASLLRQLVLGDGASLQIPIDGVLAAWLEQQATIAQVPTSTALGGAAAFAANLMSALPNVRPRFFSRDPLPSKIAARFSPRVEVVNSQGATTTKHRDQSAARLNFSCEYDSAQAMPVCGHSSLKMNGVVVSLISSGSGRVILGSKAKDVEPGFSGVDDDALAKMGQQHDLFFIVGTHYLTQSAAPVAAAQAANLGRALDVMKVANPKLVRHLQYVVPKLAAHEAVVFGALKGHVESLSMNVVEVGGLVDRLHAAGLSRLDDNPNRTPETAEDAEVMIPGARAIKDALGLSRVHLHGMYGDLIVANANDVDVDRTRLALLRARQLASMKAANESGEIKAEADVFDVVPLVQGRCLAAVQRFADALTLEHGLDSAARAAIVRDWCWVLPTTNELILFVPSRGIHDRTGGTVSLGDTIDASALVFGRTEARVKSHPQFAS